jgi:hypothetical protein
MRAKRPRLGALAEIEEASDGCDEIDVVFLDIDGVLLPFDPADDSSEEEGSVECESCDLCAASSSPTWGCDVCEGCFCSACR